ncbi:MAG TPA: tRNA (guanosine(37)-N1)-methyltransferase TrmD [Candidatus Acidoferrales bacterium]|nr:tRNA (guanosine(37)-N1)-methyltransferase TrmD [Candidatus Acidoferrales bacterium]
MRFDIVTIFPEFFEGPLDYGIVRRAREAGLVEVAVHDLRAFTQDRHRTVDDRPFGGGEGMVLKPEPLFEATETLLGRKPNAESREHAEKTAIILLSASGKLFRQSTARRYAALERILLLCGRYEGVDERVAEHLATEEISIGDYVLTGGELPAALIVDAVTRLQPGALGNEASAIQESFGETEIAREVAEFRKERSAPSAAYKKISKMYESLLVSHDMTGSRGLLDCPHYTRPAEYRGWAVPEVLLGGNHKEIRRWRRQKALEKTLRNRPDLLEQLTGEGRVP